MFQVAAHEVIMARAGFKSQRASLIGGSDAVLLRQVQHTEDAAHRCLAQVLMHGPAQRINVRPAISARRSSCWVLNGVRVRRSWS